MIRPLRERWWPAIAVAGKVVRMEIFEVDILKSDGKDSKAVSRIYLAVFAVRPGRAGASFVARVLRFGW
jgi:hypothetical protein